MNVTKRTVNVMFRQRALIVRPKSEIQKELIKQLRPDNRSIYNNDTGMRNRDVTSK